MKKPIFILFTDAPIKNIIFDLGGVILNINYQLTLNAFKKYGVKNIESLYTQAQQVGLFDKFDRGLISPQQFREGIRKRTRQNLTDNQIDEIWNAMLLDLPSQRLALLHQIKHYYRSFLLSNTNYIHIEEFSKIIYRSFGINDLSDYFEKIYLSHLIKLRKPDPEVFLLILKSNGLRVEETLFIDDSLQHVEGARSLGIQAYHLKVNEGESIEALFAH
jgi:putative hydrolase of the HAD superfamily